MSLKGVLAELRRRGVLKVAAAYAAIGWVALQGLSLLFQSFDAPGWVIKVVTTLVILGFPVACLMSWGFDITPEGVRPISPAPKQSRPPSTAGSTVASGAEAGASPSIAVLPFVDMSAEHDQQYLGDGIAEELLNALASIEGLNVAARTSSFSFHGKSVTMSEIGDALHVRHVLEGSVRRVGQKLRVTAQLIDVKSGFHLFAQAYDRSVEDIFEIQNDIAREIAGALSPKLGLSRDVMLVTQGTTNLEAYNLRLMARQALIDPTPAALNTAVQRLQQAITLDPAYGDAWGDLSYAFGYQSTWSSSPVPLFLKASNAATVALAKSPDNALALVVLAYLSMLVDRDAAASAAYYTRARVAKADRSVWAFNKAFLFDGPLGHYDQAICDLKDAERRDPLAPNVKWALIEMYLASGRIAEAVAAAEYLQGLGYMAPDAMMVSGYAFVADGDIQRAREVLATMPAMVYGEYAPGSLVFLIAAATGERENAKNALDGLLQQDAEGCPTSFYLIGEGYKALGEFEQAIDWWSRAAERYEAWALSQMAVRNRNHPVIGKEPRFLALLKRMGLESDGDAKGAAQ